MAYLQQEGQGRNEWPFAFIARKMYTSKGLERLSDGCSVYQTDVLFKGLRRRGRQRMRWLDGITDSMDWVWVNSGSWWWTGRPGMLRFIGLQRVVHDWATELNWLMYWTQFLKGRNDKWALSLTLVVEDN